MTAEAIDSVKDYINNVWGLSSLSDCDDTTMFYSCGYYEIVSKLLVEAGAVEPNCDEAKIMVQMAGEVTDSDISDALEVCLQDYQVYHCPLCQHVHYVNCIYYDEAKIAWPCDGCGKSTQMVLK